MFRWRAQHWRLLGRIVGSLRGRRVVAGGACRDLRKSLQLVFSGAVLVWWPAGLEHAGELQLVRCGSAAGGLMADGRKRSRVLTRGEEAAIGAACGSMEVCIMQPSVYWKTEMQQGRFNLRRAVNPRFAYRGTVIAATSIAPITAIQFSVNGACMSALSGFEPVTASMLSSLMAGVVSAAVQSPCQLVEINQQKHGGSVLAIPRRIIDTHGLAGMWRGWSMTTAREAIFCCSYLSSAPLLSKALRERSSLGEHSSAVVGAVLAGTIGAVLTHPADTFKTRLQGDLFPDSCTGRAPVNVSLRAAATDMVVSSGGSTLGAISKCYSGFSPRLLRLVCCTFIYGQLNEVFSTAVAGPLE